MTKLVTSLAVIVVLAAMPTWAAPVLDGTLDAGYYDLRAVQTVETGFGDNINELNAAYAQIEDGTLYLMFTGNLENNLNKLNIFIDSVAGGQNRIGPATDEGGTNPNNDDWAENYSGVGPSAWGYGPGFTFDTGFAADYLLILQNGIDPNRFDIDYAVIGGGASGFETASAVFGANALEGANANALPGMGIGMAFNNSNLAGVLAGSGAANQGAAATVLTGIELAIPLSALGNPDPQDILVSAHINGRLHEYLSNQSLPGFPSPQGNLGGDGFGNWNNDVSSINFNNYISDQFFRILPLPPAPFNIFQWEYVDPLDPSQGKQESTLLTVDGYGLRAEPGLVASYKYLARAYLVGADLTGADFVGSILTDADFSQANLSDASFNGATLTNADFKQATLTDAEFSFATLSNTNFSQSILTNANFSYATYTGADFTNADVRQANFSGPLLCCVGGSGITPAQLYSTASYKAHDLTGIYLGGNNFEDANFSGQNLTDANLEVSLLTGANFAQATLTNTNLLAATLTGADFTDADVRGARFRTGYVYDGTQYLLTGGITPAQLYSTASYKAHDLTGIDLRGNNFASANLASQNLTGAILGSDDGAITLVDANLSHANLTDASVQRANLTRADLSYANLTEAQFGQADLTDARLRHANLTGANFWYAALTGADLSHAIFAGADFSLAAMTNANLTGADMRGAKLQNTNLTGAILSQADLMGTNVQNANFSNTDITLAQIYSTISYTSGNLSGIGLAKTDLAAANFAGKNLSGANLTRANLSQANVTGANLTGANLTGATFTEAILNNAVIKYAKLSSTHITLEQLYSTASYKAHDLTGVYFIGNDLSGANFAGQTLAGADFYAAKLVGADFTNANLTMAELINADLSNADLSGANFTDGSLALANLTNANLTNANLSGTNLLGTNFAGADIRGASLSKIIITGNPGGISSCKYCCGYTYNPGTQTYVAGTGITLAQLVTTASYGAGDLSNVTMQNNNFNGGNFAGFNLTNMNSNGNTLIGADLSGADTRGTTATNVNLTGAVVTNLIQPDGYVDGLDLMAGQVLTVRDYDGNSSGTIPITVGQHFAMSAGGKLRMLFETDAWNSTISFAAGIPVALGGRLELAFAGDVNLTSQIGRTFDVFDWSGVLPTGTFSVGGPYVWDLSRLYTTGEVTFLATGGLAGDFNSDGTVNAADFTLWRDGVGTSFGQTSYGVWKSHFGASSGDGETLPSSVPEPTTIYLLGVGVVTAWMMRRIWLTFTFPRPFVSACRCLPILALVILQCDQVQADLPEIQVTKIGSPIWKPVDFQLFSAPATPFDQEFGEVYSTLLPNDNPLNTNYVPHAPPYDTELSAGALAGGYANQSVFTSDAITLDPNGMYFAYMLVPDPGINGSSRDFASGPVIPNSLFPIATNVDVWLDGVLVDRTRGADALIPVQPRDVAFQGTSHLEYLFAIWHPWDDDLTVGPLGHYDLRLSIRDVSGSGWDVVAPFQVVPELVGDYDGNEMVGPEDYDVWRSTFGSTTVFVADGNGSQSINAADYVLWRDRLGASMGQNLGFANSPTGAGTVPEPSSVVLLLLATATLLCCCRRICDSVQSPRRSFSS